MSDWLNHLLHNFADQAGTWFIGVVLTFLGIFSGRLVEAVKFALNRADLRAKYFEQMAIDISAFVFAIDRYTKVYYSNWLNEEGKSAIAEEYDETMNKLCRMEFVYLAWLQRYWDNRKAEEFTVTMNLVRAIDLAIIHVNEDESKKGRMDHVKEIARDLEKAVRSLLGS